MNSSSITTTTTTTTTGYYPADNQPAVPTRPVIEGSWSTGLCSCCEDVPNCCITCCCPCITFGRNAEIIDQGLTTCGANGAIYKLIAILTGHACCYSCFYRTKMRRQFMLNGSPCGDFWVHCCCETCALCQESRELKNRGFDTSRGWAGNLERQQNYGVAMAPVAEGGMSR